MEFNADLLKGDINMKELRDSFGRKHDYLRISITDRCNLRCIYCMGPDGIKLLDHKEILSFEEIIKFVKILATYGIKKIRITGGEPLVRKGIEKLIGDLNAIPGIEDISLTTNGQTLAPKLDKLIENGLKRVNISIDSLRPHIYREVTRGGELSKVFESINLALERGLSPVKINVVLMKGINDSEIIDFLKLTVDKPIHVRFIEYMPLDSHDKLWADRYVSLDVVKQEAKAYGFEVEEVDDLIGNGTADTFRIKGAKGTIGLIHPVSCNFCATCTRLRLTADGNFKPCLYWQEETNIRKAIDDPDKLIEIIQDALLRKHEKHQMTDSGADRDGKVRSMAQIGG